VWQLKRKILMDISGMNKGKILAALFNNAKTQGMGVLNYKADHVMTEEEAQGLLGKFQYFDYLEGRVLKIDLSGEVLETRLYNRDNGEGAAERIIAQLNE
jgi:hypothetical protein